MVSSYASVASALLPEHTQRVPLAAHVERRRSARVVDHVYGYDNNSGTVLCTCIMLYLDYCAVIPHSQLQSTSTTAKQI